MNINQIAELAGVSRATVSRYLNEGYVSQEKKERIRQVIEETGYKPSSQAQMLRTKRTGLVGVIIPKINSESVSRMVAGISEVLSETGVQLLLANTANDEKQEISYLQTFKDNHVDGIILIGTVMTRQHKEALRQVNVPVVILGQKLSGYSNVCFDDCNAAKEVTEILCQKGKQIAYIGVNERDEAAGIGRKRGFLKAMEEAELEPVSMCTATFSVDSGYETMKEIVRTIPQVDAVFCATDSIAAGALLYLREINKRVPQDVQLVSIGDSIMSTIVEPSLTTVHYYYKTSGIEAARMLLERMNSEAKIMKEIKMGYEVIVRRSTL